MTIRWSIGIVSLVLPLGLYAGQSLYCPQNHGYINIGMTPDQVISACGQPLSQQDSNQPIMQRVPVQQLIYNSQGTDQPFLRYNYQVQTGAGGAQLQIDIVDKMVKGIKLNGSDNNAFSICGGTNIQVGDQVGKVYAACGSPSLVNNTFIDQAIPSTGKPKIWIYQFNQYQPSVSLTFIDGKLQSIN